MTNAATSSAAGREGGPRYRLALRGALAAGILGLIACPGSKLAPTHDNVLLVTVDTLRADYVHSYGFFADITPNIDALAERGALFETAVATSTATVPAHASIMTSRFVREHSVGPRNGPTRLEGLTTLAERFRQAGYDTAAFVGNVVLKRRSGLDRGFDVYDDDLFGSEPNRVMYFERDAEATASRVLEWLAPRDPGAPRAGASERGDGPERPFFLWVHLQDPHGPYAPPRSFAERVERIELRIDRELATMRANVGRGGIPHYQKLEGLTRPSDYARRYAGEVAYADHWIGRIVEAVERASEGSGVVILLIADHGESLDEDGFFFQHGHSTTPEQALVPFVLVAPGIEPRRVREAVSQVDVAPTLLELAGLPALPESSGVSLLPLLLRGEAIGDRLLYSDVGADLSVYQAESYLRINGPGLIAESDRERTNSGVVESQLMWDVFRLGDEGGWHRAESRPSLRPEILTYLKAEVPLVPAHAMSDEDIARLRALGYLPPDPGQDPPR
jgi:arylsulfatase A-like enzyme